MSRRLLLLIPLGVAAGACSDSSSPPRPAAVTTGGGGAPPPQAAVGDVVTNLTIEVRDAGGRVLGGIAFTAAVTAGGGSLAGTPTTTVAGQPTSLGTWTLGTAPGLNSITVTVQGVPPLTISTSTVAGPATTITRLSAAAQTATVGAAVAEPPRVRLVDRFGNRVAGVVVTFAATGGGQLQLTSVPTDGTGEASAGRWTLGTTAGSQTATATAGTLSQTFSATATPGPAAQIQVVGGTGQTAQTGSIVPVAPSFAVRDQFGNAIAGQVVTFAVIGGGGTLAASAATTGANGVVTLPTWTLGPIAGVQTVEARVGQISAMVSVIATAPPPPPPPPPPPAGGFNIDLVFYGPALSPGANTAFQNARTSIQAVVTGDVPNVSVPSAVNMDQTCGTSGAPPIPAGTIDDLVIYVRVASIDGPGGVLAQAGPCLLRNQGLIPVVGVMEFDADDVGPYEANGLLGRVILHEMLHVLGIGTLWDPALFGLLTGGGTTNPIYTGANAIAGCLSLVGGAGTCANGIPVENTGGQGTADGHWRETIFGRELMTGFINPGLNPLSIISVRSLQDLGYAVDLARAEAYTIGPASRAAGAAAALRIDDLVVRPRGVIEPDGRIRPLPR